MKKLFAVAFLLGAVVASAAPPTGSSPALLAEAMKSRDKIGFNQLMRQKADVNLAETDGTTALHWAAHWGDLTAVDALLKAGAKAQAANRYGITPLAEACNTGNAQIIERLVKAGADANATQQEGQTPLMIAARTGNAEAARILLDNGAKINAAEEWRGQTALMWAAAEGHSDIVKLLVSRGADVNAKSKTFDFRALKPKVGSVPMNFPRGGFTALLFAARQGNMDATRYLMEGGADPNLADPDGVAPLHVAMLNLHYDLAGYLIDKGANINAADDRGRTPLYAAVDMHTMDTSNRPTQKVADKLTAVDLARTLIAKGVNVNATLKRPLTPRAVLDGADGSMGDGATPFLRAAHTGDTMMMKMLLDAGANPRMATKAGVTALMSAAGVGWRDGKTKGSVDDVMGALKMALELGLDVNAVDDRGETALHGAAVRGAQPIIEFLAANGANLQARNKSGYTALDKAMGKGAALNEVRSPDEAVVAIFKRLEAEQAAKK